MAVYRFRRNEYPICLRCYRGCPYTYAYCNSPSQARLYRHETGGKYFRKKSFEVIKKQLIHFKKEEIKAEAFYFCADTLMAYNDKEF